jgi:isoleucyl-tRNA synthetase
LNEELFKIFKDVDFAEICITSSAKVNEGLKKEIEVLTSKASGKKCSICWKISEKGCKRPNCNIHQ